jgi:hypothetical protein
MSFAAVIKMAYTVEQRVLLLKIFYQTASVLPRMQRLFRKNLYIQSKIQFRLAAITQYRAIHIILNSIGQL